MGSNPSTLCQFELCLVMNLNNSCLSKPLILLKVNFRNLDTSYGQKEWHSKYIWLLNGTTLYWPDSKSISTLCMFAKKQILVTFAGLLQSNHSNYTEDLIKCFFKKSSCGWEMGMYVLFWPGSPHADLEIILNETVAELFPFLLLQTIFFS